MKKMRKLYNLCFKEKKIIDDGRVFCPGESEIEMLKFSEWLWRQVKNYEMEAKKIDCRYDAVKYECYDAFVRRMYNFGFACIRFLAGRFASEEILFDEKDIESEEKVIDGIMKFFPAGMRDYIEREAFCQGVTLYRVLFICDGKNREWGWKEYINGIYKHCLGVLNHAKACRLYLEKFSDQDFDKINAFWENVEDGAKVLLEDYEIIEEIDKLKKEKEKVVYELHEKEPRLEYFKQWKRRLLKIANVTYNERGEIVSATQKLEEDEYDTGVGVREYNRYRFVPVEVKKLRNTKTSLETEITELGTKLHLKDRKLIEDIFKFREYNACLRFFFYLHASYQYALKKGSGSTNTFEEEYDSMVEIFMKRRCDSFDRAVMNGFRKSKNVILFNMKFILGDESNTINQIKFMPDDEKFEPINQIGFVNKSALK